MRSIFILKLQNLFTLPFTSMMWALSPGACVRDITVTAETCAIDRTVAAHCQGVPSSPQPTFAMQTTTISRWKPDPFFSLRSFLSMINLHTKCNVTFYNTKIHNIYYIRPCAVPWFTNSAILGHCKCPPCHQSMACHHVIYG